MKHRVIFFLIASTVLFVVMDVVLYSDFSNPFQPKVKLSDAHIDEDIKASFLNYQNKLNDFKARTNDKAFSPVQTKNNFEKIDNNLLTTGFVYELGPYQSIDNLNLDYQIIAKKRVPISMVEQNKYFYLHIGPEVSEFLLERYKQQIPVEYLKKLQLKPFLSRNNVLNSEIPSL